MEESSQSNNSQDLQKPKELDLREQGALRCRERFLPIPFYQEKDRKFGMEYWRGLFDSRVNH